VANHQRTEGVGHEEPVLFLTAKDNVRDKVKGLELGADDYLIKPFDFTELVLRVRTLLRRARSQAATSLHHRRYDR
jgi:two-component system copper resistance phosphate regulon response regulator CusR